MEDSEIAYWKSVWREDLRAPLRHVIGKVFYLVATGLLHFGERALRPVITGWLQTLISTVFDGLTVIALGALALPMAAEMLRSMANSLRNKA